MNILITGCFGFIGFNFLQTCLEDYQDDFNISGIDSLNNPYSKLNHNLVKERNFEFYKEDIKNIMNVDFKNKNFDMIINFAAESHVDTSIYNPALFIDSIYFGCQQLA